LIRETKIREVLGVLQDRFENLGFRPRWKHKQQTGLEEKEFLGHIVPGNFGGNMAIVCWHGMDFYKSQTSKSHVKLTIESIPRKKIVSSQDMRMIFSHLPMFSSLAPTDPKRLLLFSKHQ